MKSNHPVIKASAKLHFLRFPALSEDPVAAECLNCSSDLTLHQPDMNTPERLLGVCESCKHWYLIDLVPDVSQGVMVWLPDQEVVRELSRPDQSERISIMSCESDEGSSAPPDPTDEPKSSP